jgi:N-acetylglucosamine kinase-like BadF-type ATPase
MYYLGVDGGGTKTRVIIINDNKEQIYENIAGPSSVDTVSLETSIKHINDALKDFFNENKTAVFTSMFIGVGGIVFNHQKEALKTQASKIYGTTSSTLIHVENDMYNSLFSGGHFDQGMSLICGTGMVAFGMNKQNKTHKSGGWGYKEGELGSGYSLGFSAIQYMIRAYDGRYEIDDFATEVAHKVGLKQASDIVPIMDDLHINRTKVASLAPLVTKYANKHHVQALQIVERATDEIALAVQSVYRHLDFNSDVSLVIIGSLGHAPGAFRDKLLNKLALISNHLNVIDPLYDPAYAAALYAHFIKTKTNN